jgi:hypothetical protein
VGVTLDHVAPPSLELSSDDVPALGLVTSARHVFDGLHESRRIPPNTVLSLTLVDVHVAPPSVVYANPAPEPTIPAAPPPLATQSSAEEH